MAAPLARPLLLAAGLLLSGCLGASPAAEPGAEPLLIPSLDEPPVLDRQMTPGEWDKALRLDGTFVIDDGSEATGEYPFQMWLGADARNLYVAAVVHAGRNPWSRVVVDGRGYGPGSVWYPDDLCLFFTNGLGGGLTTPSDWKCFSHKREQGTSNADGYWNGNAWVVQEEAMGGGFPFHDGRPEGGTWGRGGYTNETLLWEIYVPRQPLHPEHDGFEASEGAAFRMATVFLRQGPLENRSSSLEFPRDAYPGPGYTPDQFHRPETWMRLRLAR